MLVELMKINALHHHLDQLQHLMDLHFYHQVLLPFKIVLRDAMIMITYLSEFQLKEKEGAKLTLIALITINAVEELKLKQIIHLASKTTFLIQLILMLLF